jgi:hypothetical protein
MGEVMAASGSGEFVFNGWMGSNDVVTTPVAIWLSETYPTGVYTAANPAVLWVREDRMVSNVGPSGPWIAGGAWQGYPPSLLYFPAGRMAGWYWDPWGNRMSLAPGPVLVTLPCSATYAGGWAPGTAEGALEYSALAVFQPPSLVISYPGEVIGIVPPGQAEVEYGLDLPPIWDETRGCQFVGESRSHSPQTLTWRILDGVPNEANEWWTGGGLPDGLAFSLWGVLTGTPTGTQQGTYTFTVVMEDWWGYTSEVTYRLFIQGLPSQSPSQSPSPSPSLSMSTSPSPIEPTLVVDAGRRIRRLRQSAYLTTEQISIFFSRFQVDLEAGRGSVTQAPPTIALQWSDDAGHTWSDEVWCEAGAVGHYRWQVGWNRLGRSRKRVWRVTMNDPIAWRLLNAYVDVAKGIS